jgi:type I restriction enzyme, S subunit
MRDSTTLPAANWGQHRLSDIATFQNGHAFYRDGYSDDGLIAIDLYNIDEEGRLRLGDRDKHVSHEICERYSRFKLNKRDLVMAMTDMTQRLGILGKCAVIDQEDRYILNQRIGRVTAHEDIVLTQYLYYFINSDFFLKPLHALAKGAVQKYVNTGDIKDSWVRVPPLSVQRRIAGILSAYDELIENNQRRIKILQEMARSLYREWFVHFRFPGHEKAKMVPSSLGPIPQGWEVKSAPKCMDINPRVVVPLEEKNPFVPMGSLSNDSMLIANIEARFGNSGAKFQNGDTLFARITPCLENGKTGFVQFLPNLYAVACGSTEFIVLRSRSLTPEFVYLLARTDEFRGNAIKSMSGASGRQRVQEKCFDRFLIAQPPRVLLDHFSTIIAPSFRLIQGLQLQVQNLRRTRDLLLPRLLSGQINVNPMESVA